MLIRLMAVMLVLGAVGAEAQTPGNFLNGMDEVRLITSDQVDDGCWPRPKETKKEVELELIRSKLDVNPNGTPTIMLEAVGLGGAGRCVVRYDFYVFYCTNLKLPIRGNVAFLCPSIWRSGGVSEYRKTEMQSRLNKAFVELARKFLYDLEKDRLGKKAK